MALAVTLHHSPQRVMEQHIALRGLKTASAWEEVENATHNVLRHQKLSFRESKVSRTRSIITRTVLPCVSWRVEASMTVPSSTL